jgi:hypothetical protein
MTWILALCVSGFATINLARADETGASMADAARRFVAALDDGQKAQATFPFDSPERTNWHWIPRPRKGLPIKSLHPDQRPLAFGLLQTGLSTRGMIHASTIMSLEEMLRIDEHGTGPVRDSELYFVSVFGDPSDQGEWGWRVEGHHLALNFTLKDGKVIGATPFMFGSNPAEVKKGSWKGLKNLGEISEPAKRLAASLTDDQRKLALVNPVAPEVTTTPNSAQAAVTSPEGIAASKLSPAQRRDLDLILQAYAANFPSPIREQILDQVTRDPEATHLAWFGSFDLSQNHAFRVQGTAFFIDYNNTQNGTNHIHTFYRGLLGDFGQPASR